MKESLFSLLKIARTLCIALAASLYFGATLRSDGVELPWAAAAALLTASVLVILAPDQNAPVSDGADSRLARTGQHVGTAMLYGILTLAISDGVEFGCKCLQPLAPGASTKSAPPAIALRHTRNVPRPRGRSSQLSSRYRYGMASAASFTTLICLLFPTQVRKFGQFLDDVIKSLFPLTGNQDVILRGRRIMTLPEAQQLADEARPKNDPGLPWCGVNIPTAWASTHFACVGKSGSGKSTVIDALQRAVLGRIRKGSGIRALILDQKMTALPHLHGLGLQVPIHILHPLDQRGVAWDFCRDCRTLASAEQWASILVRDGEDGQNRFFLEAPRHLVQSGIVALLHQCPDTWTFRDLILSMRDPSDLKRLLKRFSQTEGTLRVLGGNETALNVVASLMTHERKYETVAAAWAAAERRISLTEWMKEESVLLLGLDESLRVPLGNVYSVLIQRLTELILALPDTREVHTYLFLDEIRHAGSGCVPSLRSLLTNARTKGVCVVLGFQDIEGMRAVFGDGEANELVGQVGNIALLKMLNPTTTQWASNILGEAEWSEFVASDGPNGRSLNQQIVTRPATLSAEFATLPNAGPENGIPGWFIAEGIGAWSGPLDWNRIWSPPLEHGIKVPRFLERPSSVQFLRAWSAEERERLGLAKSPGTKPAKKGSAGPQIVGGEWPDV